LKILIITSCTGEKKHKPENQLQLEDFKAGKEVVASKEATVTEFMLPAGEMYTGQQHVRLMRGGEAFREKAGKKASIDLWVLSAGYGLISESQQIAPYESTFQGMKVGEIRSLADQLDIPADFRKVVGQKYDLILMLLGDSYLRACALSDDVVFGGPTILFCGTGMAKKLPDLNGVKTVTLSNPQAKRFSCGLVALKGELTRLMLGMLQDKGKLKAFIDSQQDLLDQLGGAIPVPVKKVAKTTKANPNVDKVISLPASWNDKPHRDKIRYFIPEWDDLVDPDYDFINDEHSGGRGDWSNEVYAHQMYPAPNYDGILMSRAVAEKSKKKKERINAMGVHRFLRVPCEMPIMGDCGAFDYIMQDVPPYSTEDVIDYYSRLGFDYGVSVDHLIVSATEDQRDFRYELTIDNAADFLRKHRQAKLDWEPIGAVQGWSPESYAAAAEKYVKMGYKYIALGGLVRSSTKSILPILEKVHEVVPSDVNVHLFGIARLNAMPEFNRYGVRSVDSASALRRAWLGGKDNYWSLSGTHYRAIRIPEAGKSFRAKNMVSEGRATAEFVEKTEKRCYKALHDYDKDLISLDEALDILDEYDHLITENRTNMREEYGRTLADKPWKTCGCDICKAAGVDVVIFRGNNRNRRRGFHNTYVFCKLFEKILLGERVPGIEVLRPSNQQELPL